MFYKEIQKLKKSELQDLLATTLNQKASLERANASVIAEMNEKNTKLNNWWSSRYNEGFEDIKEESENLRLENIEIENLLTELREESDIFRTQNIKLHKRLDCLLAEIDRLETENKIHKREKQEARAERDKAEIEVVSLRESLIKLDNLLAEGSTPKNIYIHESISIFADSGELHIEADDNKTVVFNCSTLVQDLAIINDLVIKEAKRELSANITEIKQLTKDL